MKILKQAMWTFECFILRWVSENQDCSYPQEQVKKRAQNHESSRKQSEEDKNLANQWLPETILAIISSEWVWIYKDDFFLMENKISSCNSPPLLPKGTSVSYLMLRNKVHRHLPYIYKCGMDQRNYKRLHCLSQSLFFFHITLGRP